MHLLEHRYFDEHTDLHFVICYLLFLIISFQIGVYVGACTFSHNVI